MDQQSKILIIDDNQQILDSLKLFLGRQFKHVFTEKNPNNIHKVLYDNDINLILLDMNFSPGKQTGNEGLFWLKEITSQYKNIEIILITAFGDIDLAVKGMKIGAFDFILKPWENQKLLSTIKAALKLQKSKLEINELKIKNEHLVGNKKMEVVELQSEAMLNVLEVVNKVAATDADILILGENGTGKDVIAHLIHEKSQRNDEIMLSVDLTALSENLFESELFGAEKGSYTGANELKTGKFEAVNKGTLFLDEIGNLPLHLQAKILTVIQNKKISRIGSSKEIPVDFRLISATNKNISKMVQEEIFREDLFYRLNTVQIEIPSLRNRKEDIFPLAQNFLSVFSKKYGKGDLKFTSSAIQKLEKYKWPGNVRELKHAIEKVVILTKEKTLKAENFDFYEHNDFNSDDIFNLNEMEKITIQKTITKCKGNMTHAAQLLGISRNTLYAKIEKYGL